MGSDAMRWEDNVLQVLGKTFVKYQIVEYVTDACNIGWSLNFIYTAFFIADNFYSHRSFR